MISGFPRAFALFFVGKYPGNWVAHKDAETTTFDEDAEVAAFVAATQLPGPEVEEAVVTIATWLLATLNHPDPMPAAAREIKKLESLIPRRITVDRRDQLRKDLLTAIFNAHIEHELAVIDKLREFLVAQTQRRAAPPTAASRTDRAS